MFHNFSVYPVCVWIVLKEAKKNNKAIVYPVCVWIVLRHDREIEKAKGIPRVCMDCSQF